MDQNLHCFGCNAQMDFRDTGTAKIKGWTRTVFLCPRCAANTYLFLKDLIMAATGKAIEKDTVN